jgi:hypothetical protein
MRNTLSTFLTFFAVILPFARAADPAGTFPGTAISPAQEASSRQPSPASWKWSFAPLVASQGLDIASSYGMRELNPLLAGPQDQFGVKATLLKVGITGALIGVEYLIVKAHPEAARIFTRINWSGAALTTGFAAHNFELR